jgi:hypothetical protein
LPIDPRIVEHNLRLPEHSIGRRRSEHHSDQSQYQACHQHDDKKQENYRHGVPPSLTLSPSIGTANKAVAVESKLHQSGVKNPVTAVLLNFRDYDTLLELTVLLLALLGANALSKTDGSDCSQTDAATGPVLLSHKT